MSKRSPSLTAFASSRVGTSDRAFWASVLTNLLAAFLAILAVTLPLTLALVAVEFMK